MARPKPARRSPRSRPAPRRGAKRARGSRRPARRQARPKARSTKSVRAKGRKAARKPAARTGARRRPATASAPKRTAKAPKAAAAPRRPTPQPAAAGRRPAPAPPRLDRERRRLADIERIDTGGSRTEAESRVAAAARTGREELKEALANYNATSPVLTGGDVDARWDDAYAVGDEAPGGDNPTPDQDRVDDLGKALGVVYEDNEELRASDKVAERDKHRWELDPASSEDWPHEK